MVDQFIRVSDADVRRVTSMLADVKNGANKAMVTAINDTIKTTRVQAKKALGQKLNLKASRINQNLKEEKANYSNIYGRFYSQGEPVGLVSFGATQKSSWAGTKVRVYKSSPREVIKHAFITTAKRAINVFWRAKDGGKRVPRYPLEIRKGPRIEDVLAKPEIYNPLNEQASVLLAKNLDKKIADILRRHRG